MEPRQHKIPILLDKKDVVLVKPTERTPSEVLYLSTIDNDSNLDFLCQTLYIYKSKSTSNDGNEPEIVNGKVLSKSDPALVVKEALSKALVHYYPLAGKLKRQANGKLAVVCDGGGVPFLEAAVDCHLSSLSYFDGIEVEISKEFVFDWKTDNDSGVHPLVLQVTNFSCGGFTIGIGLSHAVCDGFGAVQFFKAMAELANGENNKPTIRPVWERERLVGTIIENPLQLPMLEKTSLATSPFLPTTQIVNKQFIVTAESIQKLKMRLTQESDQNGAVNESFTTVEALGAYVWRSRFRALKYSPEGKVLFCLTVGIRKLLNPPLAAGFYGNAFVPLNIEMIGKELDECPLSKVAEMIKDSKKRAVDKDNICNSINILQTMNEKGLKIETGGAAVVLSDWRQMKLLEETDFGWGPSVNMIPLPWKMLGHIDLCVFMPASNLGSSSNRKDVRVLVCLPEAAMTKFREEMDALKQLKDDSALI